MPRLAALAVAGIVLGWGSCARGQAIIPAQEVVSRVIEPSRRAETIFTAAKARAEALPAQVIAAAGLPELRVRNNTLAVNLIDVPLHASEVRLQVAGVSADYLLRHQCVTPQTSTLTLQRYDWDSYDSDRFWGTTLSVRSTYIMVQGYGGVRGDVFSVQLMQRQGRVSMSVYPMVRGGQGPLRFNVTVKDLSELRTRYPVEVRTYLAPLLKMVAQTDLLRPGAADVYRAFADIQPAPTALKRLAQVCQSLESEDPAERAHGGRELAALGPEGVLAALRVDVERLSPELRSRLKHFLADHSHLDADRAALLSDGAFLVDCLEDPDVAVRTSAHDALTVLLGLPVEYDANALPAERARAAEGLRKLIQPPAPPPGPPQPSGVLNNIRG